MKINLNFYKEDINISNISDEFYNEIESNLLKYGDLNYESNVINDVTSEKFSHISNIRKNIVEWYDFEKKDEVLEINLDNGLVTQFLCENFKNVTSISFSNKITNVISKGLQKYDNLEIIVGKISDIILNKKYDYIVVFNCLENFDKIYDGKLIDLLKYLKELLNENGTILLGVDNPFGLKRLIGGTDSYNNIPFSIFDGITKEKLNYYFNELKLKSKFYYPLPDYKMTSVIFSDEYMPTLNNSKLLYNLNYKDNDILIANEHLYLKKVIENRTFDKYANSFFIEIKKDNEFYKQPKFVSFNNLRKEEYRLITKMYDSYVLKKSQNEKSQNHINNINTYIDELSKLDFKLLDEKYQKNIKSTYCDNQTFNKILAESILSEQYTKSAELIDLWKNNVLQKLIVNCDKDDIKNDNVFKKFGIEISDEIIESLNFTEYGYYDLVFENAFLVNNNFIFYDQEWKERNVPIEFLLYRTINNLYMYSEDIQNKISVNNMFERNGINAYIELFDKLEQKIQEKILDKNRVKVCNNCVNIKNISDISIQNLNLIKINDSLNNDLKELSDNYNELQEKYKILEDEISKIRSSKLYKIFSKYNKLK